MKQDIVGGGLLLLLALSFTNMISEKYNIWGLMVWLGGLG